MDTNYCKPTKCRNKNGIIGAYQKNKRSRSSQGLETDGKGYLRYFYEDIDGGHDCIVPEKLVREFFKKLKSIQEVF